MGNNAIITVGLVDNTHRDVPQITTPVCLHPVPVLYALVGAEFLHNYNALYTAIITCVMAVFN